MNPHERVSKAIADMEFMQRTHVQWAEFFEAHPKEEAEYVATGVWDNAVEHRRLIACYDNVLTILRDLTVITIQ